MGRFVLIFRANLLSIETIACPVGIRINRALLFPEVSKPFVSLTYRWSGMISLASSLSMFQATFVRICQHLVFCLFVFVYCGCCCLHCSKAWRIVFIWRVWVRQLRIKFYNRSILFTIVDFYVWSCWINNSGKNDNSSFVKLKNGIRRRKKNKNKKKKNNNNNNNKNNKTRTRTRTRTRRKRIIIIRTRTRTRTRRRTRGRNGTNFPHLEPMAELQRNQRGEIGHQHVKQVKAHSCSHFGSYFDHPSPTQSDDNTSQIEDDVGAYFPYSFRTMSRVLLRLFPTELQGWRRQGQRLNVTAQWCDHLNWASVISPVFSFKTLVDGPAGVWTRDLPLSRPALFQLS